MPVAGNLDNALVVKHWRGCSGVAIDAFLVRLILVPALM